MVTTIQISDGLWEKLNKMKMRGETFEDVIERHLLLVKKFKLQEELKEVNEK